MYRCVDNSAFSAYSERQQKLTDLSFDGVWYGQIFWWCGLWTLHKVIGLTALCINYIQNFYVKYLFFRQEYENKSTIYFLVNFSHDVEEYISFPNIMPARE